MKRRRRAKRWSGVGEVMGSILARVAPANELAGYSVWGFWDEEVGENIARRAQPLHFRNGVLVVTVATHPWIQELQFMKESLRNKLNRRLGAPLIRDMYFTTGKITRVAAAAPKPVTLLAGEEIGELPPIADAEIRAALARIIAARARRLPPQNKV